MEQRRTRKKELLAIGSMLLLVMALTLGVVLIFRGLEFVMPKPEAGQYTQLMNHNSWSAPYGLRMLEEQELQIEDIQTWFNRCEEWIAQGEGESENAVFWLCRMDEDEYVLYLPQQSRRLEAADITASEERDSDGEITLALRVRTPEQGDEIVPGEQLLCIKTDSQQWKGIRLKVILDGWEQQVQKLASKDGRLYSTEELHIGRELKQ